MLVKTQPLKRLTAFSLTAFSLTTFLKIAPKTGAG